MLEKKHGLLRKIFKNSKLNIPVKLRKKNKKHFLKPILVNDLSRMLFKDTFL